MAESEAAGVDDPVPGAAPRARLNSAGPVDELPAAAGPGSGQARSGEVAGGGGGGGGAARGGDGRSDGTKPADPSPGVRAARSRAGTPALVRHAQVVLSDGADRAGALEQARGERGVERDELRARRLHRPRPPSSHASAISRDCFCAMPQVHLFAGGSTERT